MRNIRLLIEYEGTHYAGWQRQAEHPTIQGKLTEAIEKLTGAPVNLTGASRTDAGVHAWGQVANFKTESRIPLLGIRQGLNSILPEDIVVKDAVEMPPDFDSRRGSTGKTYVYKVLNRRYPSSIMRNFSWFVYQPLDINLMREGAKHMIGEKDFSSFRAADSDALHSIREVTSIEVSEKPEGMIEFEVKGTAFLRHMVRIMVGTLVTLGKGKLKPDDIKAIIEAKNREAAAMTAPPQGLFLVKVEYDEDEAASVGP